MKESIARCILAFQQGSGASNRPEDRVVVEKYLAALAPLLAKAVMSDDLSEDIHTIERLFGHTWIVDQDPFSEAFDIWNQMIAKRPNPPHTQGPNKSR